MKAAALRLAAALTLLPSAVGAEEIGRIDLDLKGNDIVLEALDDPKVEGVTCHISRFDRGTLDRLIGGNWFENPSNTSIACRQIGPVRFREPIDLAEAGEVVFRQKASLILKHIRIRRIYDAKRNTLVYVAYSTEVTGSSAKNSISTVSLFASGVRPPGAE